MKKRRENDEPTYGKLPVVDEEQARNFIRHIRGFLDETSSRLLHLVGARKDNRTDIVNYLCGDLTRALQRGLGADRVRLEIKYPNEKP